MVKLSAVNRTIIGSSPIINAKCVCSSIGRISVSKTEDEGSSPYIRAKFLNYEKEIRYALVKPNVK
jgi:hypothetical protein